MGTNSDKNTKIFSYIGRFAPSPTGPLHYGSLVAAVASFLQAKQNNGQWLVRIEDIDPPREVKGATDNILKTLEAYQFEWHSEPLAQSGRFDAYIQNLNKLIENNLVYACTCSRKQIATSAKPSILGNYYPGICRTKNLDIHGDNHNLRLKVTNNVIHFVDKNFGAIKTNLLESIGDFIVYRKSDLPSYALAVSVDDAFQSITEVVRGHDLLAFTPIQIYLCKLLNYPIPNFLHIPIIVNNSGNKLSKQTGATALSNTNNSLFLSKALVDLGQIIPKDLAKEKIEDIWKWALENWDVKKIPKSKFILYTPP